jgi:hypothetical protein
MRLEIEKAGLKARLYGVRLCEVRLKPDATG